MDVLLWRVFVVFWFATFFYMRRVEKKKRMEELKDLTANVQIVSSEVEVANTTTPLQTVTEGIPENASAVESKETSCEEGNLSRPQVAHIDKKRSDIATQSVVSESSSVSTAINQCRASTAGGCHGEVVVSNVSPKKSGYFELDPAVHIEVRPGMEGHMDQIEQLREAVQQEVPHLMHDQWPMSDKALWRYLVARKFDMDGARKQVVATLKWRDMRKPDEVRAEDVRVELETGKMGLRGVDRHGRPVLVLDSTRENTWDQVGNMKGLVYTLNRTMAKMEDPVDKYVLVVRLGDTSMFNFSKLPGPGQVKETAKILMTIYAERLGHAILYQPPKIFTIFLNLFRSVFDSHVMSKAVWISGDVSPGSANDRSLTELLGPHWRELVGEGQPIHHPKWTPGYNSPVEYAKMLQEQEEQDRIRNKLSPSPSEQNDQVVIQEDAQT